MRCWRGRPRRGEEHIRAQDTTGCQQSRLSSLASPLPNDSSSSHLAIWDDWYSRDQGREEKAGKRNRKVRRERKGKGGRERNRILCKINCIYIFGKMINSKTIVIETLIRLWREKI